MTYASPSHKSKKKEKIEKDLEIVDVSLIWRCILSYWRQTLKIFTDDNVC